jgi:hypothetical protein
MRQRIKSLSFAAGVVLLAAACTETSTAPQGTDQLVEKPQVAADRDLHAGSSVAWNRTAQQLIADRLVTAVLPSRILTYLSLRSTIPHRRGAGEGSPPYPGHHNLDGQNHLTGDPPRLTGA